MAQGNVQLFVRVPWLVCVEQRGGLDPTDAAKLKINDGLENSLHFQSGGGELMTAWCVTAALFFLVCDGARSANCREHLG